MSWRSRAACRGNAELFFPPQRYERKPEREDREAEARSLCALCPVTEPCLAEALRQPPYQDYGIWAGTDEAERRRIRRAATRESTNA